MHISKEEGMDFHMSMSDMWLEYTVARNMNSSLSWFVLPHLPLQGGPFRPPPPPQQGAG